METPWESRDPVLLSFHPDVGAPSKLSGQPWRIPAADLQHAGCSLFLGFHHHATSTPHSRHVFVCRAPWSYLHGFFGTRHDAMHTSITDGSVTRQMGVWNLSLKMSRKR